jgi:hypothetical protein
MGTGRNQARAPARAVIGIVHRHRLGSVFCDPWPMSALGNQKRAIDRAEIARRGLLLRPLIVALVRFGVAGRIGLGGRCGMGGRWHTRRFDARRLWWPRNAVCLWWRSQWRGQRRFGTRRFWRLRIAAFLRRRLFRLTLRRRLRRPRNGRGRYLRSLLRAYGYIRCGIYRRPFFAPLFQGRCCRLGRTVHRTRRYTGGAWRGVRPGGR